MPGKRGQKTLLGIDAIWNTIFSLKDHFKELIAYWFYQLEKKKTQKLCWSRGSDDPKIRFSRSGEAIAATDGSIHLFGGMVTSGFGRGPRSLRRCIEPAMAL